jgi:hypothetical protein
MTQAEESSKAGGLPPEILAVIAAAIASVIDEPFRITGVSERRSDGGLVSLWSIEGRREIFSSHHFR